jgi:hypothetical protein
VGAGCFYWCVYGCYACVFTLFVGVMRVCLCYLRVLCVCIYGYVFVCIIIYVFIYVWVCMYLCAWLCIYAVIVFMYLCIYAYGYAVNLYLSSSYACVLSPLFLWHVY